MRRNKTARSEHISRTSSPSSPRPSRLALSPALMDTLAFQKKGQQYLSPADIRQKYGPAHTLGAPENVRIAMDSAMEQAGFYSLMQHGLDLGMYGGMSNFLGYAALQNIAQNGLIRACVETVADDMTRNWIELTRKGEMDDADGNGQDDALEALSKAMDDLELQKVMHEACSMVGYYGGCLLFLDTGATGSDLLNPLNLNPDYSIEAREKGFLKAVRPIDPINIFPGTYNASNPLAADYYAPKTWWVLGQQVHSSRLLRLVANEVPLIYKPSYNFLGIPQAQILWDYVMHFQQNRDSANRLLNKFSMLVFKTSMGDIFNGGADFGQLDARMQILTRNQSNDGVFAIDKEAEDVVKVETPLSGVVDIVRQSLETLAAMNRTPAVKLLGISPSGFNATGESDLRNYYDHVLSQQEKVLRAPIKAMLDILQISLTGTFDSGINFDFRPLSEDDKNATAMTQQVKINSLCALLDRDVVAVEEVRKVLAEDPDSGLNNIDPDDVPAPRDEAGMGGFGGEGESLDSPEAEEVNEGDLSSHALGMDANSGDKSEWFTIENGTHVHLEDGESKRSGYI